MRKPRRDFTHTVCLAISGTLEEKTNFSDRGSMATVAIVCHIASVEIFRAQRKVYLEASSHPNSLLNGMRQKANDLLHLLRESDSNPTAGL